MDTKQEIRDLLDRLPDGLDSKDVLYHLSVYVELQERRSSDGSDETRPQEEVAEEVRRKWARFGR